MRLAQIVQAVDVHAVGEPGSVIAERAHDMESDAERLGHEPHVLEHAAQADRPEKVTGGRRGAALRVVEHDTEGRTRADLALLKGAAAGASDLFRRGFGVPPGLREHQAENADFLPAKLRL